MNVTGAQEVKKTSAIKFQQHCFSWKAGGFIDI